MKRMRNRSRKKKGVSLLFSIILVFCILGAFVFSVSRKMSDEMSESAIQNLRESLELIKCTIEAILKNEAEFQKLIAQEIADADQPQEYVRNYKKNQTMVKMSLILTGETEGISNTGEVFSEEELDFSSGRTVEGLAISQSYLNYMGTWAYTIKCPVIRDEEEIAVLYIEYIYDSIDKSLPKGFYDQKAMLYIMDAKSERLVLKPKGMGERSAGHLNLEDFYRANDIQAENLRQAVSQCLKEGDDILFYHDIRGERALNYMWAVNDGAIYLIGYVPVEAIQQEGKTVNQNIFIVVFTTLAAFILTCVLYFINKREQDRLRREREEEREVHNKQLADALQAAQIASNSKTTFLSNMSHDIRTPMNAVLGFATLLAKDAENPAKVREYTKKILASGQHLLSLINDILDVSKIESGKVVLNFEKFSLSDLVSSVDAIIRPMAKEKNQKFHVEVSGIEHEYLMGDETRINQILLNLLSNAVKYTQEEGDIWFRIIGLGQRSAQFEHIRIEVEDNGFGMTPEYLEIIFDAFTRAENSTTNKVQGTGLGMAITKNIVELMGGTIKVFSEVDKGSLFRVELEFRIPEDQADKKFWEKSGIRKILALDCDAEVCRIIQGFMGSMGILADIAFDSEEALRLIADGIAEKEEYQAVLLDWYTMGADAVHITKKIKDMMSDTVFLLFMTSDGAEGLEEALRIPGTGILPKPFFVSAFKEKIQEMKADSREDYLPEISSSNLEGLHFLAAEDNEINAEILGEILEIEGADCVIAENGQLVLECFMNAAEGEFDAILMDVQMPVMNGYDATRAIRSLERSDARTIPIIAMTANAFAEDEKEALEAGMNVHVAKPIDIELLKKVIKQCMKERKQT